MELAFAVVSVLAVATLVALLVLLTKYDRLKKVYSHSLDDRLRLEGELVQAHVAERRLWQSFVDTLKEMRKEGFQTVPSDEVWAGGGYALTPEQEARIERDRREGVGPGATFDLKDNGPTIQSRPTPARPSLRIEE